MTKVLFILKRRIDYNAEKHNKIGLTTGLYNSATFVCNMLNDLGIDAVTEVVVDNNCIDKAVTEHKPTHVVIEAIWVTPEKFHVLQRIHPTVKWIVRIHSEFPFLASEGMSLRWFGDYSTFANIILAPNTPRMTNDLRNLLSLKNSWTAKEAKEKVILLPNYYPQKYTQAKSIPYTKKYVDIGCFGAIRPLKNQLLQAVAAIKFAESINKTLRYHINAGRIEMKGEPVLHNLRGLFEHTYERGHQLLTHQWSEREQFLELCYKMDVGLQVSFSETFNIVAADFITQGVPVVASKEIPWSVSYFNADPTDSNSIFNAINKAYQYPKVNVILNRQFLHNYTNYTKKVWYNYFKRNTNV